MPFIHLFLYSLHVLVLTPEELCSRSAITFASRQETHSVCTMKQNDGKMHSCIRIVLTKEYIVKKGGKKMNIKSIIQKLYSPWPVRYELLIVEVFIFHRHVLVYYVTVLLQWQDRQVTYNEHPTSKQKADIDSLISRDFALRLINYQQTHWNIEQVFTLLCSSVYNIVMEAL